MVVNLCLPHFETTVQCNKLSADGYDVSNLLSADAKLRLRGFRLEYFLRPPVHVTLRFRFRVEICRVDVALWPSGMDHGQMPRGLEIHMSSNPPPDGPHLDLRHFRLVGRCEVKEALCVSFALPCFRSRPPFPEPPPEPPAEARREELWSRGPQSLGSVTQLRVSLPYGGAGSPLGLKALAVWGLPAHCCPPLVLERIVKAHQDSQRQASPTPALPQPSPPTSDSPFPDSNIPQEFLDPFTQEVMTLPLLLPSGVVIDNTSLEKYQRQEASWGRLPNDPFTGIPFTRDSQPLPNPDMKGRIDRFLLHGGAAVGRTGQLGRVVQQELPHPSRLVNFGSSDGSLAASDSQGPPKTLSSHAKPQTVGTPHPEETPISPQPQVCGGSEIQQGAAERGWQVREGWTLVKEPEGKSSRGTRPSLYGRKRALDKHLGSPSSCRPGPSSLVDPDSADSPCSMPEVPPKHLRKQEDTLVCSGPSSISHEQRLSESLDQALKSALGACPGFTAHRAQEPGSSNNAMQGGGMGAKRCGQCSCAFTAFPGSPPAFRLPCGHLLCRPCLSTRCPPKPPYSSLSCPTCGAPARPSSVVRVHC
ncbi:RING finger protein 37 isoform X2 [Paramormyrops kingsleyae]|nr:RING finger protein 37 isoform X2 [Paramormyrops kingsleyae]XP_023658882.1 RING finger protein 37 isoform X2 [Paramormyrops kingsleyae]XP_023658883.1 RING finger protein 37 isoform X2 [Paramormyrops kingsleyae]